LKVITTILGLRVKQFYRILGELGIIHLLVLSIALIPLALMAWAQIEKQNDLVFPVLSALALVSLHLNRGDKSFLEAVIPSPKLLFFVEYLVLMLPAILFMVVRQRYDIILGILCFTGILSLVKLTIARKTSGKPVFPLPDHFQQDFEWISGIRKQYFSIGLIYIAGLVMSWWSPAIPLVALFLLGILVAMFYMESESHNILEVYSGQAPKQLMRKKIKRALLLFWAYCSPLVLLFMIFHYEYWYIFLILLVIISLMPVLGIVLKYSHYVPGESLKSNELILGIMIAFLAMPFTQPVPMIFAYRQYKKAIVNLKNYLDDPTH